MTDVTLTTNVTLNGETVDVTVYEDIDNTGVTDNSVTFTAIAGGTTTYNVSQFLGGPDNAYWAGVSLSSANATASPVVHSVTLDVPVAGSIVLIDGSGVISTSTGVFNTT